MSKRTGFNRILAVPLSAIAAACLTVTPVNAGDKTTGSVPVQQTVQDKEGWLKFTFKPEEQKVLREYYLQQYPTENKPRKQKQLPPGLQKKLERGGQLPPGWQKKVARGEVMPPEVYKQSTRVPQDVWVTLPPQPPGTTIVNVEGKVVRLMEATRTIIDVLDLAGK